MGQVVSRMYRDGVLAQEGFPLADVPQLLAAPDTSIWVDLCGPSEQRLRELTDTLGLHDLTVEDALDPHRRPKLDRYERHLFLSCRAVRVDVDAGALLETEVDAFLGERWLITIREDDATHTQSALDGWDGSSDLAVYGVSALLHGLLDTVVDGYLDAVQVFDDYYDAVSEGIFADRPLGLSQHRAWFDMRRAMFRFHRLVVPMREMFGSLLRREHPSIAAELHPHFQDLYDRVVGVIEEMDTLREVVGTLLETNLGLREYRQNLIMKKVSSWAAIVAVPTLVTSFYGMNVPYPGSHEVTGVVTSTGLMIVACIVLYHLFRRFGWL